MCARTGRFFMFRTSFTLRRRVYLSAPSFLSCSAYLRQAAGVVMGVQSAAKLQLVFQPTFFAVLVNAKGIEFLSGANKPLQFPSHLPRSASQYGLLSPHVR